MFMTWILTALLIVTSLTGLSEADPIYGKVGGFIVLNPGQISEPIQSATWKHNADLAVEWFGQELVSYRTFEGRCDFDKNSGNLTINSLTLEDSGSYTPEINNKVLEKKELQVIKPVPKPTVSMKYHDEKTSCSLTCEAQVTADFGPVMYKWKTGDTELSTDKELLITTENKESSFFCELVNPVSSSSSETVENPFITDNHAVAVAVPVVIILLLVVAGIVAAVLYRKGLLPRLRGCLNGRKKTILGGSDVEAENDGVSLIERVSLLTDAPTADVEPTDGNHDQRSPTPDSNYEVPLSEPDVEPTDGNHDQRSQTPDSNYEVPLSEPDVSIAGIAEASSENPGSSAPTEINHSGSNGRNKDETESATSRQEAAEEETGETKEKPGSSVAADSAATENKEAGEKPEETKKEPGSSEPAGYTDEEKNQAAGEKTVESKEKPGSSEPAGSADTKNTKEINNYWSNGKDHLESTSPENADGSGIKGTKGKPESSQDAGPADTQLTEDAKKKPVHEIQGQKSTPPDSAQPNSYKSDEDLQQASDPADNNQVQIPASATSIQLNSNKSDVDQKPINMKQVQTPSSLISSQPNSNESDGDHQQASDPANNNQVQITASPISIQPNGNKSDADQKPINTKRVKTPSSVISSQPNSNESDGGLQQASDPADNNQVQIPASATSIQPNSKKSDNSSLKQSGEKTPDPGSEDEEQSLNTLYPRV